MADKEVWTPEINATDEPLENDGWNKQARPSAAETYQHTFDADPDEVAKVRSVSRATGLDPAVVDSDREYYEKVASAPNWDEVQSKAPNLYDRAAADPTFMTLARDDIATLTGIESNASKPEASFGRLVGQFFHNFKHSASLKTESSLADLRKHDLTNPDDFAALKDGMQTGQSTLFDGSERTMYNTRIESLMEMGDSREIAEKIAMREVFDDKVGRLTNYLDSPGVQVPQEYQSRPNGLWGFAEGVSGALGGSALDMGITAANPVLGMSAMFATLRGAKAQELRAEGINPSVIDKAATISAAGQAPLEFAGTLISFKLFGKVISGQGSKSILRESAKTIQGNSKALAALTGAKSLGRISALTEGSIAGALEEYLQVFPDEFASIYAHNADAPMEDIFAEFFDQVGDIAISDEAIESAAIGAAIGGLFPGVGISIDIARDIVTQSEVDATIGETQETLDTLKESVTPSTLMGRDKAEFTSYIQEVYAQKGVEEVYIDAKSLMEYIEENVQDNPSGWLDGYGLDASALVDAARAGETVRIDIGSAAWGLGSDPHFQALKDHVVFDPADVSKARAEEEKQTIADIQERIDELKTQGVETDFNDEAVARVRSELEATGMPEDVARKSTLPLLMWARANSIRRGRDINDFISGAVSNITVQRAKLTETETGASLAQQEVQDEFESFTSEGLGREASKSFVAARDVARTAGITGEANVETRRAEAEEYGQYALDNELTLSGAEILSKSKKENISGTDNHVYFEGDRVIKTSKFTHAKTFNDFFEGMILHNELFPDAEYTLEGFAMIDGELSPVTSQQHFPDDGQSKEAKEQLASDFLTESGFERIDNEFGDISGARFIRDGIEIKDIREANIAVNGDQVYFFDPIVKIAKEQERFDTADVADADLLAELGVETSGAFGQASADELRGEVSPEIDGTVETFDDPQSGKTLATGQPVEVFFTHNTESSPDFGGEFQQDIDPAGRYMTLTKPEFALEGDQFETGDITFNNPLVLEFNTDGTGSYNETSWKARLFEAYGGLTGTELSQAIVNDGFDAIITVESRNGKLRNASETVDLTTFDPDFKRGDVFAQEATLPDTIEIDGVERSTLNSEGQPIAQTEEGIRNFYNWFGDSKVVDEQGNPKVIFHGTQNAINEDFAFDYSKIGEQGRAEGAGFYFTNNIKIAEAYADENGTNIINAYMKIENPLRFDQEGFDEATLEKIIRRVDELEVEATGEESGLGFLSNIGDVGFEGFDSVLASAVEIVGSDDNALDQLSDMVGAGVDIEIVNKTARDVAGIDGVITEGFSDRGDAESSIYVSFFPENIKSVENVGTFDPQDPRILFQEGAEKDVVFKVKPPRKLYRGTTDGAGAGVGGLGKGLYSSPKKSFAAKFGAVEEVDPLLGFPRNPLVLRNAAGGASGALSDYIFKNTDFQNMREFNKVYSDPSIFVKELGFDGIITGDEVVRYPDEFGDTLKQERQAQIAFNFPQVDITLFENADFSSFLHEISHLFLADVRIAAQEGFAFDQQQLETINNWFLETADEVIKKSKDGITKKDLEKYLSEGTTGNKKKDDAINVGTQEQFAAGFETYYSEGMAPSNALAEAFESFRRWLTKIYRNMLMLDVTLTDEVRQVFDRMLATEEEILQKQEIDGMFAMFDDKFMDSEAIDPKDRDGYKKTVENSKNKASKEINNKKFKNREQRVGTYKKTADAESFKVPVYKTVHYLTTGVEPIVKGKRVSTEAQGSLLSDSLRNEADQIEASTFENLIIDGQKAKATVSNAPEWYQNMNRSLGAGRVSKSVAANALRQYAEGKKFRSGKGQDIINAYLKFLNDNSSSFSKTVDSGDLKLGDSYLAFDSKGEVQQYNVVEEQDLEFTVEGPDGDFQIPIAFFDIDDVVTIYSRGGEFKHVSEIVNRGKAGEGKGLDPNLFLRDYGETVKKDIPTMSHLFKEGGMSVQEASVRMEYDHPDDLVNDLTGMKPRKQWIEEKTAALEVQYEAGLNNEDAIHNEIYARQLEIESKWLADKLEKETNKKKNALERKALRAWVKRRVSGMSVPEATNIKTLIAGNRKLRKRALIAAKKGEWSKALELNEQVRVNEEIVQEKYRFNNELKKIDSRFTRTLNAITKKDAPKRYDFDYVQQILVLARRFLITNRKLNIEEGTPSLFKFMQDRQQLSQGTEVFLDVMEFTGFSDEIIDGLSGPWKKELSVDQVRELDDLMKWLKGKGRAQREGLLTDGSSREAIVEDLVGPLEKTKIKKKDLDSLKKSSKYVKQARRFWAEHTPLQFIMMRGDLFKRDMTGPHIQLLFNRLSEANGQKEKKWAEVQTELKPLFDQFQESAQSHPKILRHVPIPDQFKPVGNIDGMNYYWTYDRILSAAMNMGNQDNLKKMLDGYTYDGKPMSTDQLGKLTSVLSVQDWRNVQKIWDVVNSFWEDNAAMHMKINFYKPRKIAADPIVVKSGDKDVSLAGGYYPLKYDRKMDMRVREADQRENILQLQESVIQSAKPKAGFNISRTDSAGGRPISLSTNVLMSHLDQVISYITMGDTLVDVDKITSDARYKEVFISKFGPDLYEQIRPALAAAANPRQPIQGSVLDELAEGERSRATAFILFYNAQVALKQPFSIFNLKQAMGKDSTKYLAQGYKAAISNPVELYRTVNELSPNMAQRSKAIDRDLAKKFNPKALQKLSPTEKAGQVLEDSVDYGAIMIRGMDYVAAYPGWWASYQQGLEKFQNNEEAVAYADNIISSTQPTNRAFDRAFIQRSKHGVAKMLTMFTGYTMTFANRRSFFWEGWKNGQIPHGEFAQHVFMERMLPAMLMTTVLTWIKTGELPDEEDILIDMLLFQSAGRLIVQELAAGVIAYRHSFGISTPLTTGADIFLDNAGRLMKDIEAADGEKFTRDALWTMLEIMSYIFKIPVSRVTEKAIRGMEQIESGEGAPINVLIPGR